MSWRERRFENQLARATAASLPVSAPASKKPEKSGKPRAVAAANKKPRRAAKSGRSKKAAAAAATAAALPAPTTAKVQTRLRWQPADDTTLKKLVGNPTAEEAANTRWSVIARTLSKGKGAAQRSGKQCRERWHNHLKPGLKFTPFDRHEDTAIVHAVAAHGSHWVKVATSVPGRSHNSVKNRWHTLSKSRKHFTWLMQVKAEAAQALAQAHAPANATATAFAAAVQRPQSSLPARKRKRVEDSRFNV